MYSHIKHVSLALCQQENMDAPSRSTWKTSRLFSHAEKHGHLYFAKIRWYNEIICVLPDNKPRTRDFFPLFCQSLLCYGGWRGCCALSFSLPASRLWLTAGPLSSLLLLNQSWCSLQKNLLDESCFLRYSYQETPAILNERQHLDNYTITLMAGSIFKGNFCQ